MIDDSGFKNTIAGVPTFWSVDKVVALTTMGINGMWSISTIWTNQAKRNGVVLKHHSSVDFNKDGLDGNDRNAGQCEIGCGCGKVVVENHWPSRLGCIWPRI